MELTTEEMREIQEIYMGMRENKQLQKEVNGIKVSIHPFNFVKIETSGFGVE